MNPSFHFIFLLNQEYAMCFNRKKIIERAIQQTRRNALYPDLSSMRTVGYLFSGEPVDQQSSWIESGIALNFNAFCYLEGKRGNDNRTNVIYRSDLNLLKLPPDKLIRNFIEMPFDILINLAGSVNDVLTYICAISKAHFKVCYTSYENLYDLVIELDENHKQALSGEVIKTLVNLKSKE